MVTSKQKTLIQKVSISINFFGKPWKTSQKALAGWRMSFFSYALKSINLGPSTKMISCVFTIVVSGTLRHLIFNVWLCDLGLPLEGGIVLRLELLNTTFYHTIAKQIAYDSPTKVNKYGGPKHQNQYPLRKWMNFRYLKRVPFSCKGKCCHLNRPPFFWGHVSFRGCICWGKKRPTSFFGWKARSQIISSPPPPQRKDFSMAATLKS